MYKQLYHHYHHIVTDQSYLQFKDTCSICDNDTSILKMHNAKLAASSGEEEEIDLYSMVKSLETAKALQKNVQHFIKEKRFRLGLEAEQEERIC